MASTTKRDAPVLSLSTVVTRPKIRIDGTLYELRSPDEVSWLEYREHAETFREASALMTPAATVAQRTRLKKILPRLVGILVVGLPVRVLKRLKPDQQLQIVATFSDLLLAKNPRLAAQVRANADRSSTSKVSR